MHVVRGSVVDRLTQIVEMLDLPVEVPLEQAAEQADRRVRAAALVLEEQQRILEAQRRASISHRLASALRY